MSSSTPDVFTAAVLTVSDSSTRGERADVSGPAVVKVLENYKFQVVATQVVPDDRTHIENALLQLSEKAQLVVSTGGTGVAERDVTPDATRAVCERLAEGVVERMRFESAKKTPLAALGRGVCGLRGKSLILNLPGSPKGAVESLEAVIEILPHALKLLAGDTQHS
ncbi:MAG TPA: MogA/MoaB family molybdenum cofactor biosynthesis protein [Terriglobales bacterium]